MMGLFPDLFMFQGLMARRFGAPVGIGEASESLNYSVARFLNPARGTSYLGWDREGVNPTPVYVSLLLIFFSRKNVNRGDPS